MGVGIANLTMLNIIDIFGLLNSQAHFTTHNYFKDL